MIIWESYAPGTNLDPHGSSVSLEYATFEEDDYLEIDEQLLAQFLGLQ